MNAPNEHNWIETNRQALNGELRWLRQLLENAAHGGVDGVTEKPEASAPILDFIAEQFQLSGFERALLLLCAGVELESDFAHLCAVAQDEARADYPTFGLALAVLPGAHWSALSPQAPLRYWHLVALDDPSRISSARLSVDERLLHFLVGVQSLDARLEGVLRALPSTEPLPPSHAAQVQHLCRIWTAKPAAAIHLGGADPQGAQSVAARACATLSLHPLLLRADAIPANIEERELLARLLQRECRLVRGAVVIENLPGPEPRLAAFADQLASPVLILGRKPEAQTGHLVSLDIDKPTQSEQLEIWREAAGDLHIEDLELRSLISNFDFSCADILAIADETRIETQTGAASRSALGGIARRSARGGMEHLAQRVEPRAGWDDLPPQLSILSGIARQVRHRATVYEQWGFAAQNGRGLGISALFAGDSGTGKTLAAEVLAGDLGLDLYRIDLSAVVSKYIGETEKNLERLFKAAETSGAVLLFDEADALFGKRSEVKDSRDRYANIEVSYLLQRMETYRGLAILTSNFKTALDTAFHRRFRFIVHFPFPDAALRETIWKRMFPQAMPRQTLDYRKLAQLSITGGTIRNIALNAAFLAADTDEALGMHHLLHAAKSESAKLERPLSDSETRGWL